jgi:hypothetical protein
VYFITKGSVNFTLSPEYESKEIREIKRNSNFGEIEMCLSLSLAYNIIVKSRNCELFVLKKEDFLKISMRYREYIHKFLQRSLMVYMRYNDIIKRIIREFSNTKNEDTCDLGEIREEDSEYNIFSEKISEKDINSNRTENSEIKENGVNKAGVSGNNNNFIFQYDYDARNEFASPHFNPKSITPQTSIEQNSTELQIDKHIEKLQGDIYLRFSAKVEKLLNFFDEKGVKFNDIYGNDDPISVLQQLRSAKDINERNELLEKLEVIVSKVK